jgi:hypothetical protein
MRVSRCCFICRAQDVSIIESRAMHWVDLVGYLASGLVVLTFYMGDMISLRVAAIFSNVAFLAYGICLGLGPVILLHSLLLPLNVWRLRQLCRSYQAADDCSMPTPLGPVSTFVRHSLESARLEKSSRAPFRN